MFSEVCTPLITRCLRTPLLYIGGACSLARSHQPLLWCGCHHVPKENKARGGSTGSLIVKIAGSDPGEACRKAHRRPTCAVGRPEAIHEVTQPGAWPLRGISCEGLQRGLGESLRASRYIGKNTGVVDGSLHISILLFSFRNYIDYIISFAVEIATH